VRAHTHSTQLFELVVFDTENKAVDAFLGCVGGTTIYSELHLTSANSNFGVSALVFIFDYLNTWVLDDLTCFVLYITKQCQPMSLT
jgi:hypothetical protein